jgi:hypothetical protein
MQHRKLTAVAVFAIAMAYLESAVVVYLRRLYHIDDIATDIPNFDSTIAAIEFGREAATILMLLSIGWIAGQSFQSRIAFAFFTFGIWDIFYYFWLWVFIGWPTSLLDTDLLFLIPLPWWGPVLSPILIAVLMVVGGIITVGIDQKGLKIRPIWSDWTILFMGTIVVLYTFMADALAALPVAPDELNKVEPTAFHWSIYSVGFILLSWAVWQSIWVKPLKSRLNKPPSRNDQV